MNSTVRQDAIALECPSCSAKPGEPCLGISDIRGIPQFHSSRFKEVYQEGGRGLPLQKRVKHKVKFKLVFESDRLPGDNLVGLRDKLEAAFIQGGFKREKDELTLSIISHTKGSEDYYDNEN